MKIYFSPVRPVVLAVAIGIIVGVDACTRQSIDSENPTVSSFGRMQDKILTPTCATAGCHASTADNSFNQHKLVLEKSVAYENLFGIAPVNLPSKADGHLRVKAFKALESLLYHKLNWDATHHGGKQYGLPMPLGSNALSVGQIEFVRRWIEAGAPKTGDVVDATLLEDKTPSVVSTENFIAMDSPKAEGVDGFQLRLDKFTIQPNFEREIFVRRNIGNTTEIYVNKIKLQSRPNSHHMVLYDHRNKANLPAIDQVRDLRSPDGKYNVLTLSQMANHVFLGGGSESNQTFVFPAGTALMLPANYSIELNAHYFNKTTNVLYGENVVNLYTTPASTVRNVVKTIDFANTDISLPPKTRTVIIKDFTFSTDANIVSLTSHTHQYGEKFVIKLKGGPRDGEIIYENTDWEHPIVKNYDVPIALKKGEGITSVVTFNNTSSATVKRGSTSEDEMDIIFGYYYEK